MAINSARIKSRLKALTVVKRTEFAMADFRSLTEVKLFLTEVNNQYETYMKKLNVLSSVFDRHKRGTQVAAPNEESELEGFTYRAGRKTSVNQRNSSDINGGPLSVTIGQHDFKTLHNHFKNISDLSTKEENLDTILAMLNTNFRDDVDAQKLIKYAESLRAKVATGVAKAYSFMDKVANGLEPDIFKDIVEGIISGVEKQIAGEYENAHEMVYLVPLEKKGSTPKNPQYDLEFVHYFGMENAHPSFKESGVEPTSGYSNDNTAYLIFVGVVDMESSLLSMYVTYADTFIPPHKVIFGRNGFSNIKSGLTKALTVLNLNYFSTMVERPPLPETKQRIKESLKYSSFSKMISGLEVQDEKLILTFKSTINDKEKADNLANKIVVDLYSIFRSSAKQDLRIKYSTNESDEGAWQAEFYLDLPNQKDLKAERIDTGMVEALRKILPISDAEIRRLVQEKN